MLSNSHRLERVKVFETDAPWWPYLITCSIFNKQGWIMHLVLIIHLKGWIQNLSHRFRCWKMLMILELVKVSRLWAGDLWCHYEVVQSWPSLDGWCFYWYKCSWQVGCWIRGLSFRCWRKLKLNEQITYLGTARLNLRYSNLHDWYK